MILETVLLMPFTGSQLVTASPSLSVMPISVGCVTKVSQCPLVGRRQQESSDCTHQTSKVACLAALRILVVGEDGDVVRHGHTPVRRAKPVERAIRDGVLQPVRINGPHTLELLLAVAVRTSHHPRDSHVLKIRVGTARVENLDGAALEQQGRYDGVSRVRVHHRVARVGAGRLPAEDDAPRVAAEGGEVVAQPLEREALVADAEVLVSQGGRIGEAEDVEAVAVQTEEAA